MVKKEWLRDTGDTFIITFFNIAMAAAAALVTPWLTTPLAVIVWLVVAFIALLLWNRLKKRRITMADRIPPNKSVGIYMEGGGNNRVTRNRFEGLDEAISVKDSHDNMFDENEIISSRNNQQQENNDESHQPDK